MAKRILYLLTGLSLLLSSSGVLAQSPGQEGITDEEPFELFRIVLPNGVRVWVQPRPKSESVALRLVLKVGARSENASNNGISHFLEHLLFVGNERWSEEELKSIITRRGGYWNGWTGLETTTYYAELAREDLDLAMDWLSQLVFHATLPESKVEKERKVIFQEDATQFGWVLNTMDRLGFGYALSRDLRRAMFPGSSLGLNVIGTTASMKQITREELVAHYEQYYSPDNATLIVVGGVTPEQVIDQARTYFGDLTPRGHITDDPTPLPVKEGPYQVITRGPDLSEDISLLVGARTMGSTHSDNWALEVLAQYLELRLTEEIRHRRGLVYGIGAYNVTYDDAGYFVISTSANRKKRDTILELVRAELARVQAGDLDSGRVEEAKAALKGHWALAMDSNDSRAGWLSGWTTVLGPEDPIPDYTTNIDRVAQEDLVRVCSTYFVPEREFVAMHLPALTARGAVQAAAMLLVPIAVAVGARWTRRRRKRTERPTDQDRRSAVDEN